MAHKPSLVSILEYIDTASHVASDSVEGSCPMFFKSFKTE